MPLRTKPPTETRPIIGLLAELHDCMEQDFEARPSQYCARLRVLIERLLDLRNECDNCGQHYSNNAEVVRVLGNIDD